VKHFTDRVAVITGAGSGIGRALALELAERGAQLALSDINEASVSETVTLCQNRGAQAKGYRLDVADREQVTAHAAEVVEHFGRVNIVVNNAGVALKANVEEMSYTDLDWLMGINFWGVVHGTKAFLPHLIASGDGHLVNISSVFGLIGVPTQSAYNAAKFGVRGFTEALRQEMLIDRRPVGVSCVHPGASRRTSPAMRAPPTTARRRAGPTTSPRSPRRRPRRQPRPSSGEWSATRRAF
jgi:NAD(P)-dependent dehydrogenase (short-subunit alcohol dehydrogenase family)